MQPPRTWTLEAGEVNGLKTPLVRGNDVPVEATRVIELEPVLDLLGRGSEVIGKLLEALPAGGPAGLELLALLNLANDFANDRDTILRA